jgi:hypothetical protein
MNVAPFPQAAIAALQAEREEIAQESAWRMRATIMPYAGIPVEKLAAQNGRTLEQIARMMDESNFPVAREYFEKLTETRARAGISIDDFLQATEVMMQVVTEHIERAFAHDPAYRDRALRVLHAGTLFTRNVIGRSHLREVVERAKIDRAEKA